MFTQRGTEEHENAGSTSSMSNTHHILHNAPFIECSRLHQRLTSTFNLHKHKESLCPTGSNVDQAGNKQDISGISVSRRTLGMLSHPASDFTSACSTSQLRELEIITEKTEKERRETVQQVIADSAMCFSLGF
ncbi:hypothetical protein ABG768_004076 [Culter alburnus]|uniref:Uncharacterized protein n=1 Tax=Culter alburnus TaxID=194366 RepID=A0AAW2A0K4_CULAL